MLHSPNFMTRKLRKVALWLLSPNESEALRKVAQVRFKHAPDILVFYIVVVVWEIYLGEPISGQSYQTSSQDYGMCVKP